MGLRQPNSPKPSEEAEKPLHVAKPFLSVQIATCTERHGPSQVVGGGHILGGPLTLPSPPKKIMKTVLHEGSVG
jgi:hypothetical protein